MFGAGNTEIDNKYNVSPSLEELAVRIPRRALDEGAREKQDGENTPRGVRAEPRSGAAKGKEERMERSKRQRLWGKIRNLYQTPGSSTPDTERTCKD